ncbi:DUF5711 family protein [Anaerosporobacter faecicola]|uniref:DUF5711 family protein n=1 Tax=Anaerosporobacter faecicola TaxID=2718714 RepID=UPI001439DF53|nr:DUF5711 family protein [Anaerosporobacter faecicola]
MKKIEKEEDSGYEKKLKRYKQRKAIIITFVCIFVLAVGFYFVNKYFTKNYNAYKTIHTTQREDSNTVQYMSYDHKLLKYSRDGISAISADGKVLWNASYDVKNPKVVVCEKYVAVADIGGKQAYTFNSKGTTYNLTTTLPIIDVAVSHQGVLCVTVEGEDYNQVLLYDSTTGTELVQKQTSVQTNGYPVDVGLSIDAKKMACSYVRIENGVLETDVGFYNFTQVGANYQDQFVGIIKDQQSVVHDITFLDSNTVLLCSEKGFFLYEMYEVPSMITSKTYEEEIESMFYTSSYFGFITKDSSSTDETGRQLYVYNRKGKNVLKKDITFGYQSVQMSGKDIIFQSETELRIIEVNGNVKLKTTLKYPIVSIMPYNNKDEYIIIDDKNINHIKLVEEKK